MHTMKIARNHFGGGKRQEEGKDRKRGGRKDGGKKMGEKRWGKKDGGKRGKKGKKGGDTCRGKNISSY